MNLVTIIFKNSQHCVQLHYDKYADSEKAMTQLRTAGFSNIDDDYGCKARINTDDVSAVFLTDLDREMAAHEEVEISKHRKDIRVTKTIQREQQSGVIAPRNVLAN